MFAFYRSGETLIRIYDHGTDWRVVCGPSERWCSTWAADRRASLVRAVTVMVEHLGQAFDPDLFVITGG